MVALEVWGDYALFTRPETKVERLSYPVMTPSAARAIFDAIYIGFDGSTPPRTTFFWQVRRIEICHPISFMSFSRNEVKGKANSKEILNATKKQLPLPTLLADGTDSVDKYSGRTQRQSRILRDVRYRIFAEPVVFNSEKTNLKEVLEIFKRRAKKGKCRHQPFLGCREFVAYFAPTETEFRQGIDYSESLGWMVYDIFDLSQPNLSSATANLSIFRAEIVNGVLEIPPFYSPEVRKLGIEVF